MPDSQPSLFSRIHDRIGQGRRFIQKDLWLRLPERPGLRFLYRVLRMGVLIFEGFMRSDVFMLAAALTYQVLFALVPLLVVLMAIIKGLGGFTSAGGQVQILLLKYITPAAQEDFTAKIDAFIQNVNAAAIGLVGFAALLYTSISLLSTIEKVFNTLWGIKTPRTFLRRFMVYWIILTLSPVLLLASVSMTAFVQSSSLTHWLNAHIPYFSHATLLLTPFVVTWVLFTGFYIFMPNTRVHPGAALIGALVAGTAWEGMKTVYFWYNTHVLTNYKFYGSLGSIPVFLLWVYLSWIVVLFGAEIVFAAQHVNTYQREIEQVRLSAADRDRLALVICLEAVKPFQKGEAPPSGEQIAAGLNLPVRVVNEILFELSSQGILRTVTLTDRKDPGYLPARDPGTMTAKDVIGAVRRFGDVMTMPQGPRAEPIYRLIDAAESEAMGPLARVTVRELLQAQERGPSAPPAPQAAPGPDALPGKTPA